MQGAISQFVVYFESGTPDATLESVREKLYLDGYRHLGETGTLTGLAQPRVYLDLDAYDDYLNKGSYSAPAPNGYVEWRQITDDDYNPTWDTVNWTLTDLYTSSENDQVSPGFYVDTRLTVRFIGVFLYQIDMQAMTALSGTAVKTVDAQATMNTVATLTCAAVKNTGIVSNQSSEFTITADVNLGPAGGAALFDHQSTLSVITGYLRDQTALAQAEASVSADAMVIPPISGDAALTVFASQTTVAGYLISALSTQTASTTVTAEGTKIDPVRASGTLVVETAITITAERIRPGISLEMSASTLTADATVIPPIRAEANLSSAFTLTAAVSGEFRTIVLVASAGTMTITPVYTAGPSPQLSVVATITTTPSTRIGIVAVLQATGFVLTAGDVINIDPALTLRILAETRTLIIDSETRTIMIRPESRTLTIEEIT
jgi:hypothetical protein